jgi:hypothetical protein
MQGMQHASNGVFTFLEFLYPKMQRIPSNINCPHKGLKNTLPLQEETRMLMMFHCFISLQPSIMIEQPYLAQDD